MKKGDRFGLWILGAALLVACAGGALLALEDRKTRNAECTLTGYFKTEVIYAGTAARYDGQYGRATVQWPELNCGGEVIVGNSDFTAIRRQALLNAKVGDRYRCYWNRVFFPFGSGKLQRCELLEGGGA